MNSSINPTVSEKHPADAIADFIEAKGWTKGAFYRRHEGYCITGAGQFIYGVDEFIRDSAVYRAVQERLGLHPLEPICDWNDKQKSKEDVIRALRGQRNE